MNWKPTWLLLLLALVLSAFIFLVERHSSPSSASGTPPPRLFPIQPSQVSSLLLRRTNQILLRAERLSSGQWQLTTPVHYPANQVAIGHLLEGLNQLLGQTHIPLSELSERNQTAANFGLDVPVASLTVQHSAGRAEISFGHKTPVGDNVYLQVSTQPDEPGIYVVPAGIFDRVPQHPDQWRDTKLLTSLEGDPQRIEVRTPGGGFEVALANANTTNAAYFLTKPTQARADNPKVNHILNTLRNAEVVAFVPEDPPVELERLGLQPPQAELTVQLESNNVQIVQFGGYLSDAPGLVPARRLAQTNIVLLPREVLDALRVSPVDLRDKRVLALNPAQVDLIEVRGSETFSVRKQTNGAWIVQSAPPYTGDVELIHRWLARLASLEGVVEKDVVTDFNHYGLAEPLRQYTLSRTLLTPAARTNLVLDQLDIGAREPERVFVRRASENTVYFISRGDYNLFPSEAWQLRDRRVWTFTTNQIKSVTATEQGNSCRLIPNSKGGWTLAPGFTGIIKNPPAISETLYRLGQLKAEVWVARGAENKALYGFREGKYQLEIELENGGAPRLLTLQFGSLAPSEFPYALATVDGQSWIFEFPLTLFIELLRDLPAVRPGA